MTMKPRPLLLFAALLTCTAALPAAAGTTIDCAQPKLPSQREVASLLEISNFHQTYAARARLMQEIRRHCKRSGADRLLLVAQPAPGLANPEVRQQAQPLATLP